MLFFQFVCGLTLVMEEVNDRKVGMGMGMEVKTVSNMGVQAGLGRKIACSAKSTRNLRFVLPM